MRRCVAQTKPWSTRYDVKAMARWCSRHRWMVLAVWLVALVGSFAMGRAAGTNFSTKFQLPNIHLDEPDSLVPRPRVTSRSDQIMLVKRSALRRRLRPDSNQRRPTVASTP